MEFVDKIRAMPAGRQILLAAGSLAIAGFVAGAIYFVFLRQPDSVLFDKLKPLDAATIVAELDKRKVPYHLADGGTTILVAANQVDATRLSILSQDLPLKGTVGFELFNKSDIGLTEFEQRINYQRALQGELARTIMALDEIDTARVHLSLPEPTIFRDDKRAPKASVALTLKPGKQLPPAAVAGIQRIVAAAVSDLDVADVVVVDGEGQVISPDVLPDAKAAETPNQRAAESYYAARVRRALAATYPGQDFSVTVTATLIPGKENGDGTSADTNAAPDPFTQWTPEQRAFSLEVGVVTPAARDAESQKTIRMAAEAAIADDPAQGDVVTVALPGAAAVETQDIPTPGVGAAGTPVAAPVTGTVASRLTSYLLWVPVLVIALFGLTFAGGQLLRVRRPTRRLTEAERRDFAVRFQTLLEQGGADAGDGF